MRRSILVVLLILASLSLPNAMQPVAAGEKFIGVAAPAVEALPRLQEDVPDRNEPVATRLTTDVPDAGDLSLSFYESPAFGYVVPWDEQEWDVESNESGDDGDFLVLGRGDDAVTFRGFEGHDGDPEACLRASVDELEQTSGVEIELGTDTDGNPMEGADEFHAWSVFVSEADADREQPASVWHLECRRLVPGSAVLAITYKVPRDRYEDLIDSAYLLMDSVVMPRASYDLDEVDGRPVLLGFDSSPAFTWLFPRPPGLLLDRSGDEVGMATLAERYIPDEGGPWYLFVVFENSGAGSLAIDPLAVRVDATSQTGETEFSEETLQPTDYRWETGDGDPSDLERIIESGQRLIVQLVFDEPFFGGIPPGYTYYAAVYETEQTPSAVIGTWEDSAGAGGRPRLG